MRAMTLSTIFLALALALALVSLQTFKETSERPTLNITILEQKLGKEILEVLQHPDSVVAFTVDPSKAPKFYTETSSDITLSIDLMKELQQHLLNDKYYVYGMTKRSPFLPSVAFKFFNKEKHEIITILLSPTSKQIRILAGQMNYLLDYEPSQVEMNAFIKKIEKLFSQ